ncbi:pca operon transcription factor PcaQ [Pseudomonas knackmussii B13]|uniref:Pca operon transcription factor PcaQ n=1 Tax=Pseudomonas knackmussii (strain DSM 6978 / CCUG 54928 / LMG 23759 / B13) TaxID=1301098 RepID=A0A024HF94_PSEKB|nr:pca operon transcription factor PcaQ [Pseudomonas knackmussii]CDF83715.1 pca operon transcription factor PcaQ [Pseudomonas knackmussii B13]
MNIDSRIKFRHLQCFLEVARQGSRARAAARLAVSQPAVSKTLKELEEVLAAQLFERGKGGAVLTEAGMAFLRYAGPCVQALREGVESLRGGEYQASSARLGVLSTVEGAFLPEVVRRLHERHSALVVSVVTGPSAHLLSQLRVGELDLVVGRMTDSPQIQGLTFEHLYNEPLTLVVRAGHPLLDKPFDTAALEDFPMVLPTAGTTIRKRIDSLFVEHGLRLPQRRLETLSLSLSRRYVDDSDAVWVAPTDAVRAALRKGELAELAPQLQEAGGSVGICSNASLPLSLGAHWCQEVLREVGREYREGAYP